MEIYCLIDYDIKVMNLRKYEWLSYSHPSLPLPLNILTDDYRTIERLKRPHLRLTEVSLTTIAKRPRSKTKNEFPTKPNFGTTPSKLK